MWILPNNLTESSVFAQECGDLKGGLNVLALMYERSAMWRSKHLLCGIWLGKWKKVYWLQHLFGRTLKPSLLDSFTEKYTESLEVIHVSRFPLLAHGGGQMIPDTSGRSSKKESGQLDLFGAFLKTSQGTLHSDMILSGENYRKWVIGLRKEYSLRKKSGLRTSGSASTFSRSWQTPTTDQSLTSPEDMRKMAQQKGYNNGTKIKNLASQVNWGTPRVPTNNGTGYAKYLKGGRLEDQVANWPTPTVAEAGKVPNRANYGQTALSNHPAIVGFPDREKASKDRKGIDGQPDQEKPSTNGKRHVLNPAWVLQLMGTSLEQTFCEWRETALLSRRQK